MRAMALWLLLVTILVAFQPGHGLLTKGLTEDVANASSAVANFTADTFIFEQRVGKFLVAVDGPLTDIVKEIEILLITLGVSGTVLTSLREQIRSSNSSIHASTDSVVLSLRNLEPHLMLISSHLQSDLTSIESDLDTMNVLTANVQREYTAAVTSVTAEVDEVEMAILAALEGQSGPEVDQVHELLLQAGDVISDEWLNIQLAKLFYDESRVLAEDALNTVVEDLQP